MLLNQSKPLFDRRRILPSLFWKRLIFRIRIVFGRDTSQRTRLASLIHFFGNWHYTIRF